MALIRDEQQPETPAGDYQYLQRILEELVQLHRQGNLHQIVILASTHTPAPGHNYTIFGRLVLCDHKKHRAELIHHFDKILKEAKEQHRRLGDAPPGGAAPSSSHGTH